jgi:hypothetical protein
MVENEIIAAVLTEEQAEPDSPRSYTLSAGAVKNDSAHAAPQSPGSI